MKRDHGHTTTWAPPLFLAILLATLFAPAQPAHAHERVEVGPYVVIVGWRNEPVIVGERNALVFDIRLDGEPVEGAESAIDLAVLYGGRTFRGNLEPTQEPGFYVVEILPTVRGQYEVQLEGSLGETAVNLSVEPEEVLPASVLAFPESPPDAFELQESVTELTGQLESARLLAIIGVAVGVLGLLVAIIALLSARRRR